MCLPSAQPLTQTGMKITVRTMGGSCCEVASCDQWTRHDIGREIERQLGVPVVQQQLIHGYIILEDVMRPAAITTMGQLLRMEGAPGMSLELSLYIRSPASAEVQVAIKRVRQNGEALGSVSEELKGDREVVIEAVRQDGWALRYASEELRRDREVVTEAVRQQGSALQYVSPELKHDREVVMEAVRQNGHLLRFASEELKRDREVVMEAIRQDGYLLRFASEELRRDREVVTEAVSQDGSALRFSLCVADSPEL
jgi:precorrin-6B methylase 2